MGFIHFIIGCVVITIALPIIFWVGSSVLGLGFMAITTILGAIFGGKKKA